MKITIQKNGRMTSDSINYLTRSGMYFADSQEMIVKSNDKQHELIKVRDDDIPNIVYYGGADLGIIGKNELLEREIDLEIVEELDFAQCKIIIAVPNNSNIITENDLDGEIIATSYPNILKKYLKEKGIRASIIHLAGSVEIAPQIGLATAICDITQTGKSLKENNLRIIAEVMQSNAVLVKK